MESTYCDSCHAKLEAPAARDEHGKLLCSKCMAEKQPAPAQNLKFYFCETCGKRITEIHDKKLKGIYCKSCAVGVTTMEFDAITDVELATLPPSREMRKPSPPAGSKASAVNIASATRTQGASHDRSGERLQPPPRRLPVRNLMLAASAAVFVVCGVIVLVSGGSKTAGSSQTAQSSAPPPVVTRTVDPDPSAPSNNAAVAPPVGRSDQTPTTPVALPAVNEAEERAVKAYDALLRFDGLAADDNAARVERIDTFLTDHGESIVAGRARILRKELAARQPAPPPKEADPVAPVAPVATITPPPPPPEPDSSAGVKKMLRQVLSSLGQSDLPAANRAIEQTPDAPADVRSATKSALDALQKREAAWHDALTKLRGQKVRLETKSGVVEGAALDVEGETLKIEKPLLIDGEVKGSSTIGVALAEILPASRDTLAPLPAPNSADEKMAQALLQVAKQEFDSAETTLALCDGPLQSPLKSIAAAEKIATREARAQALWKDISSRLGGKLTQAQAKALQSAIAKFETDFADSAFLRDADTQQKLAAAKDDLGRLILGMDPRVAQLFKGKITAYDARTQRITVVWDPITGNQKDDFEGSETNKAGFNFQAKGIYIYNYQGRGSFLQLQQFLGDGASIKFDYKDLTKISGGCLGVAFFGNQSKAASPHVMALIGGQESGLWDMKADSFITKIAVPGPEPLPKNGTLEASMEGKHVVVKSNGKTTMEGDVKKPNDHAGLGIGGGHDTTLTITRLEVSARLDPKWLARKLEQFSPEFLNSTYLCDMPESDVRVGYGVLGKRGELGYGHGEKVTINGKDSPHALSMHAAKSPVHVIYMLDRAYKTFRASVAMNDTTPTNIVCQLTFKVRGDDKELWTSKPVVKSTQPQDVVVDVSGVSKLVLEVDCAGQSADGAHSIWIEPRLEKK
jgi:DNA-directed RNA polymerase subunit RPC12/RpoP